MAAPGAARVSPGRLGPDHYMLGAGAFFVFLKKNSFQNGQRHALKSIKK